MLPGSCLPASKYPVGQRSLGPHCSFVPSRHRVCFVTKCSRWVCLLDCLDPCKIRFTPLHLPAKHFPLLPFLLMGGIAAPAAVPAPRWRNGVRRVCAECLVAPKPSSSGASAAPRLGRRRWEGAGEGDVSSPSSLCVLGPCSAPSWDLQKFISLHSPSGHLGFGHLMAFTLLLQGQHCRSRRARNSCKDRNNSLGPRQGEAGGNGPPLPHLSQPWLRARKLI